MRAGRQHLLLKFLNEKKQHKGDRSVSSALCSFENDALLTLTVSLFFFQVQQGERKEHHCATLFYHQKVNQLSFLPHLDNTL